MSPGGRILVQDFAKKSGFYSRNPDESSLGEKPVGKGFLVDKTVEEFP